MNIYSNNTELKLVRKKLYMLLLQTKYGAKIFNSDQGSQYTSYEHTQLLKKHDIQISMNGKGMKYR